MRNIRNRTRHVILIASPLAAAGCGGDGDPATAGLDSPDIPLQPGVEEVYTVGVLDGAAWEMFGSVRGVAFGEDGSLFILDNDAGHVVVVDPAGQFVRAISNKGEGPGELNQAVGLAVLGDGRIAVNDMNRGIRVFSREGESLQEAGFTFQTGMPGPRMFAMPDHSLLSAGIIGRSFGALMGEEEEEEEPEGRPIGRFRLDGTQDEFHSAWAGPPVEDTDAQAGDMRIIMSGMEAFPLPLSFGVLRDGRVVLADSVGYRVKILDGSGEATGTLERPIPPVAVTDEIRDAERDRRLAALAEGGSGGGGGGGATSIIISGTVSAGAALGGRGASGPDPDAMRRMREDRIENMAFPEEVPVISRLAVDWSDRIWVQRSALMGEPGPTDILTADGQYFGTIAPDALRIPAAFGPGGLLAYIDRDELDIQRVRVVRLAGDQLLESGDTP
ncbi:6-bladed beta-propeller [Candidatus Palauibacter sp.]|uniref:6-bladed beta-propeller n=1 Tax=Candidatus Palauibacter sp. TaxID=3101350 RepID=UPI003B52E092